MHDVCRYLSIVTTFIAMTLVGCQRSTTPTKDVGPDTSSPVATSVPPIVAQERTGSVKIELIGNNPAVFVVIDGNEYSAADLSEPIALPVGSHTVTLRQNGVDVSQREITVAERKRHVVRLADRDREAAEWVAGIGGRLYITVGRDEKEIKSIAQLPETFTVAKVDLSRVAFNEADLRFLSGLKNLGYLGIRHVSVTDAGLVHLQGLPELWELSAEGTKITDAGMAIVKTLPKLRILRLDNTPITDAGLAHVEGLDLHIINLSQTRVSDDGLKHLSGMSDLHAIWANKTNIGDNGFEHLVRLANLTHLGLSGTQVSDVGVARLKALPKLRELYLAGTRVTDTGAADLQSAIPDCKLKR